VHVTRLLRSLQARRLLEAVPCDEGRTGSLKGPAEGECREL